VCCLLKVLDGSRVWVAVVVVVVVGRDVVVVAPLEALGLGEEGRRVEDRDGEVGRKKVDGSELHGERVVDREKESVVGADNGEFKL